MANKFKDCGPQLTNADLDEVEGALGIQLPLSLREHYLVFNGGRPQKRVFMDADDNDYEVKSFRPMKYQGAGDPLIENTYVTLARDKAIVPERLLPFASDSGGDLYCIDLHTGEIWFWAADDYEEGDPESAAAHISGSLDEFISAMVTTKQAYG